MNPLSIGIEEMAGDKGPKVVGGEQKKRPEGRSAITMARTICNYDMPVGHSSAISLRQSCARGELAN